MTTLPRNLAKAGVIDQAARTNLLRPNAALDYALSNSAREGLPSITISPLQGQWLAVQCQLVGAKSVLEVGTLGGYSTIWFASTGAQVTSIDINPKHREVARHHVQRAGYGDRVDLQLGDALTVMNRLTDEGRRFDFVFIDADWTQQAAYFEAAVRLTRRGGCIYVDNVVRQLLKELEDGSDIATDSMLAAVGRHERVQATLVPMLNSHKGKESEMFDGVVVALVK